MPFNADTTLYFQPLEGGLSRTTTVSDLEHLAATHHGNLYLATPDPDDFENTRDVIYVGEKPTATGGPVQDGGTIQWLDGKTGRLLSTSELGTRPFEGELALAGSTTFRHALADWAASNGVRLEWDSRRNALLTVTSFLLQSGIGNGVMAAFILAIVAVLSWQVSRARSRTYRLLSGVPNWRIHARDLGQIAVDIGSGLAVGLTGFGVWLTLKLSVGHLSLLAGRIALAALACFLLTLLVALLLSLMARPTVEMVARRAIPLRGYQRTGTFLTGTVICAAMLILPSTAQAWVTTKILADEHSLWASMRGVVRVSLNETDTGLSTEEGEQNLKDILASAHQRGILMTSYVIDQGIELDDAELEGFDHIVITDQAWINHAITNSPEGAMPVLQRVDYGSLAPATREFLDGQMPLLLNPGRPVHKLPFFELNSGTMLALPPDVGLGSSSIQTTHPLLIVTDNVTEDYDVNFLRATLSSGNLVFTDEAALRSLLAGTVVEPYVSEVESIADLALGQAQRFAQQASYYLLSCILLVGAIAFGVAQRAMLWAAHQQRRIFAAHTFGIPYRKITAAPRHKEGLLLVVATAIGTILSRFLRFPEPFYLIGSAAFVLALGWLIIELAFATNAKRAFTHSINRTT
ncbi:DUF6619 domain-containing protein [Actinobaculum sp. 352]|uniref:DUF6619 domain-containing protein n=1 Tax=Actinobaculum sp. 352 TaxID=2490946 RepID=UPI000FA24866|nr:DUF6619 domain-containing protein [Actinobaculum sp. 352]RTE49905.1 hypothetical protein EKN07_05150 [Actinobaculum sp. 352]